MKKQAQKDWQALVYRSPTEISTLEEVEATLLRQFDVPKTQLEEWEEWGSLRQGDHETAHVYCTECSRCSAPHTSLKRRRPPVCSREQSLSCDGLC